MTQETDPLKRTYKAMTREDMRERDAELCAVIEQQQEQLRAVLAHVEELRAAIAYVRQRSQPACEILNEFDNTRAS